MATTASSTNAPDGVQRTAIPSECGTYRYRLGRRWGAGRPLLFVMLNPSTADAERDDPTIRRCVSFARANGYAAMEVVNLFAYRATDPRRLKAAGYPVGPDNDRHIREAALAAGAVCVAWGVRAAGLARPARVLELLRSLGVQPMALAVATDGSPAHPLMLAGSRTMAPYDRLLGAVAQRPASEGGGIASTALPVIAGYAAAGAAAVLALASPPAWSQTAATRPVPATPALAASMPGAQEREAARRLLPSREQVERAAAQQRSPTPTPGAPGVAPSVPPAALDAQRAAGALDLSTLAQQYERMRLGPNATAAAGGAERDREADREAKGLVAFVSLGMPAATLERLIADAERLHAPLVLRGITGGSIRATAQQIERLNAGRKVGWQIDPAMFKRFDVRAVPAFVLVDPARPVTVDCSGAAGAAGAVPQGAAALSAAPGAACRAVAGDDAQAFSKVTGDVSFGHALAEIERADPTFAQLARRYAARLKTTGGAR